MPIPNLTPVPHPAQPGVTLGSMALDGLTLTSGAAVDGPARLVFSLRPYAETDAGGVPGYIAAPPALVPPSEFVIADVYAWIAERAQAGDPGPAQAMAKLVQEIGAEYVRRGTA